MRKPAMLFSCLCVCTLTADGNFEVLRSGVPISLVPQLVAAETARLSCNGKEFSSSSLSHTIRALQLRGGGGSESSSSSSSTSRQDRGGSDSESSSSPRQNAERRRGESDSSWLEEHADLHPDVLMMREDFPSMAQYDQRYFDHCKEWMVKVIEEEKQKKEAGLPEYIDPSDLELDSEEYAFYEDETNPDRFDYSYGPNREEDEEYLGLLKEYRWFHDKRYIAKQVAAMEEDAASVKRFDPRCSSAVAIHNEEGKKLIVAARNNQIEKMQQLLANGVSPAFQDITQDSPLHWAAISGSYKAVRLLLGEGADINVQSEKGRTPLHHAVASAELRVVHDLIHAGADVNVEDRSGFTPLDLARHLKANDDFCFTRENIQVIHLLEAAGARAMRTPSPERDASPERQLGGDFYEKGEMLVNQTEGKRYDLFDNVWTEAGDDPEEIVDVNCSQEEWGRACDKMLEEQRQELKEEDPVLAKKLLAVELGREGDLDELDAPRPPQHEKFIPWYKQMRGKKLTMAERERMDQYGKKAVPKPRRPR